MCLYYRKIPNVAANAPVIGLSTACESNFSTLRELPFGSSSCSTMWFLVFRQQKRKRQQKNADIGWIRNRQKLSGSDVPMVRSTDILRCPTSHTGSENKVKLKSQRLHCHAISTTIGVFTHQSHCIIPLQACCRSVWITKSFSLNWCMPESSRAEPNTSKLSELCPVGA